MKTETRFERAIHRVLIFAVAGSIGFLMAGQYDLLLLFFIGVSVGTLIASFIID